MMNKTVTPMKKINQKCTSCRLRITRTLNAKRYCK